MTKSKFSLAALLTAVLCIPASASYLTLEVGGGWAGNSLQIPLHSSPLWTDFQAAVAGGGSLSFDWHVVGATTDGTCTDDTGAIIPGPNWLEPVIVFNSGGTTGGWDQNVMNGGGGAAPGIYGGQWPLPAGGLAQTVSIPMTGPAVASDGLGHADVSGGWTNMHIGVNTDNSGCTSNVTIMLDNVSVGGTTLTFDTDPLADGTVVVQSNAQSLVWVQVPEPEAGLLFAFAVGAVLMMIRRK